LKGKLRRRYLILELGGGGKENLLERLGPHRSALKLIPLGPRLLLLRCSHLQVEELRRSLESGEGRVLGVSGTIRGARRILEKRGIPTNL
jgi:hypothetical protein